METLEQLQDYLAGVPAGPVPDAASLAGRLAQCWDQIDGSGAVGVTAADLAGRLQNVFWRPPILSFRVQQNGTTSSGPPLRWELDVSSRMVMQSRPPVRPFTPTRPKFNTFEIAEQIARLITDHRDDPRLRWYSDGGVRVAVGIIFPEGTGFKQTVSNRRRKFRFALDERLTAAGWRRVKDYVYAPPGK